MTNQERKCMIGWIERSIVYPETMFDIVLKMLGYFKSHGFGKYVREELVDKTIEFVSWAKERGDQPLVAFLVFWWLYGTWDDFIEMTNDIEREVNPRIPQSELNAIKWFALSRLSEYAASAYVPDNVHLLTEILRKHLHLGAHIRMPAILNSVPFDPTRIDKESNANLDVFLPSDNERNFVSRVRRIVAGYVREIDWEYLDIKKKFDGLAIHVPAYDKSGAESSL